MKITKSHLPKQVILEFPGDKQKLHSLLATHGKTVLDISLDDVEQVVEIEYAGDLALIKCFH